MKKIFLISFLLSLALAVPVSGQSNGFGAGIMLGEPTGISLKSWLTRTNAWDAGIAWGMGKNDALYLHGDYLWHNFNMIKVRRGSFPLYYGLGGRVIFADEGRAGVRGVIGLDYLFPKAPLDLFFEIAPVFDLIPETNLDINGALGIRYYF